MRNSLRLATLCLIIFSTGCAGFEHRCSISYTIKDVEIEIAASRETIDYSVSVVDSYSDNR